MKKELYFYNLCDKNISHRCIEKVISVGITPDNITDMNLENFANIYGVRKPDLLSELKEYSLHGDLTPENLSIYALIACGVSSSIIENAKTKGLDKVIYFYIYSANILKNKFEIKDLEIKKIYAGLELLDIEINYESNIVKEIIEEIELEENYIINLKNDILKVLDASNEEYLDYSDLLNEMPIMYKYSSKFQDVLKSLANAGKIEINEQGLRKCIPSLSDFIEEMPEDRKKKFLLLYLSGKSYDEIGKENGGVTRELVRQQLAKINFPKLKEDELIEYFTEYSITEDMFYKLFDVDKSTYRYVQLRTKKYGKKNIEELLDDPNISDDFKNRIEEMNPNNIYINGVKYQKNMTSLFRYYSSRFMLEPITMDEVISNFILFWEETTKEAFDYSQSSLRHAIENANHVILNKEKGWRYYDVISSDVDLFIEELNLIEYENKEVSSSIIFNSNKELMKSYDIRDEYELHNLMKKTGKFNNADFGRVPMITFGNANRDQQIEELLLELYPVSQVKLIDEYHNRYGHNKKSAQAYIASKFSNYYIDGRYDLSFPMISDDEVEEWKNILVDDLYFHDEVEKLAYENGIKFEKHILCKPNLDRIGYTSNNSYIYSNKYLGVNHYFSMLLDADIIDLDSFNPRMTSLMAFRDVVYEKYKIMELFEYEPKKYISIKRLNELGISKEDLIDFIDKVYDFANKNIFTITKLLNDNFSHPLFDLGFDNIFYSSVLRNSNKFLIRRLSDSNDMLLVEYKENYTLTIVELIKQILLSHKNMNFMDMLNTLKTQYGIEIPNHKLKEIIKDADIFYDNISNNLYYDYATYNSI